MSTYPETSPVKDSISKINNEFAVGADPRFQARWQSFERIAWAVLTTLILLSLAGVFGRGPLANADIRARDGSINVAYERIQRFGTPSVMTVNFPASSIHDGSVRLWISDSLVKPLGTQRIVPQPQQSIIGGGGILYTFAATTIPASIEFQTQPSALGKFELKLQVPGKQELKASIFVAP